VHGNTNARLHDCATARAMREAAQQSYKLFSGEQR
jgi:hypothetical protein